MMVVAVVVRERGQVVGGAKRLSSKPRQQALPPVQVYSQAAVQEPLLLTPLESMIEFFLPNSRALLPTFRTNCPDGSHFAQMGSNFQNTTTNP